MSVGNKIYTYLDNNIDEETLNFWRKAYIISDELPSIKRVSDADRFIYGKLFKTQLVDETGKRTAGLKPGFSLWIEDAWSDSDSD